MFYEKRHHDICASYEKRLTDERNTWYHVGIGSARTFALRTTKEIKGAWRHTSREIVIAFVWADDEVKSLAGDIGDLDMFQISPEIKAGIKAFCNGAGKVAATAAIAVTGLPSLPLGGFGFTKP